MWNWIRNIDMRKVAGILAGLTAIEALIAHGDITLAGISPATADVIKTWCGNFVIINQGLLVGHMTTALPWPKPQTPTPAMPKISPMAVIAFLIGAAALFEGWGSTSAHAADLPAKAKTSPFVPASAGGWYVGLGTSAGVAQSSVGGNNLFAPSLVGGNLVADGASVDVVGGYIRNGGPFGTWWRLELGASYENISGGTPAGSVNSRWRLTQEADVGADILQSIFSAVGNAGNLSSTFSSLNSFVPALPSNVTVVGTPRQYIGVVAEEFELGGTFGAASGQMWGFAPGVKTGWIWELPGSDGKTPNGNALEVFAEVLWPTQGASFANVFASGGAPLTIGPAVKEGTQYFAGVRYLFGL